MTHRTLSILLCLLLAGIASSATVTWQGDDLTNPTYWNDVDNWDTGTVPADGDDVVLSNAANCNVNANTAALKSFNCTGYTGTLSGTGSITVTQNAAATSVVLFAGTNPVWSGVLTLNPVHASAIINLTMGTLAGTPGSPGPCGGVTIGTATSEGNTYFLDGFCIADTKAVTLTSGTLHTDGADDAQHLTHSWGSFVYSGTIARVLSLGNSVLGITGSGSAWAATTSGTLTVSVNTATITLSGDNASASFGGKVYGGTIAFTGSGQARITTGGAAFGTLTRTGTGNKTDAISIVGNQTITTALNLNGNSATARPLVTSDSLGTPLVFTVTGATISANNVDFRDITLNPGVNAQVLASVADNGDGTVRFTTTGNHGLPVGDTKLTIVGTDNYNGNYTVTKVAATTFDVTHAYAAETLGAGHTWTYDLTDGGSNLIGDCGGNVGMTCTPATTQTCTGNSANASAATWTSHYPLPQDTEVISLTAGQTLTQDMPRMGKDISFGTETNLTLGTPVTSYGSVNLTGMGTFSGAQAWYFESQSRSGTITITNGGNIFPNSVGLQAIGATIRLGDSLACTANFVHFNGIFSDEGFSVTALALQENATTARTVIKSGPWTFTKPTAGTAVNLVASGLSWSDSGPNSSITIVNPGTTFAGANQAFNNVNFPAGAAGTTITGSNTFNNVTVAPGGKLVVTNGTNQTVKSTAMIGTSAAHITLASSTPGSPFTLTDSDGGVNRGAFVDVTDCTATGASWFVGSGGTMDVWSDGHGWDKGTAGVLHYYQQLLENQ